jgi:DNA-binding MarR family transcriptional regulator
MVMSGRLFGRIHRVPPYHCILQGFAVEGDDKIACRRGGTDSMTRSQGDLDQEAEEVTLAVMAASRLLVAISARALASTGSALTLPQLRALVVLETCGPVKLAALASTLGVNPSTALRMAGRLEDGGLVDRRTNPANRREVILRLTPAGRDVVERVLAHRRTEIRALVERLPAEARAGLVPALKALTGAAGEMAVDPVDEVRRTGGLVDDPLGPASGGTPPSGRHRPRGGTA